MSVKGGAQKRETEKMSDGTFRMMTLTFNAVDFFYPYNNLSRQYCSNRTK